MKRLGLLCAALLLSGCTLMRGALPVPYPTDPTPAPAPVSPTHHLTLTNDTPGTYHLAVAVIDGASRVIPSQGTCVELLGVFTCFIGDVAPHSEVTLDAEGLMVIGAATWGDDAGKLGGTTLQ